MALMQGHFVNAGEVILAETHVYRPTPWGLAFPNLITSMCEDAGVRVHKTRKIKGALTTTTARKLVDTAHSTLDVIGPSDDEDEDYVPGDEDDDDHGVEQDAPMGEPSTHGTHGAFDFGPDRKSVV